MEQIKRGYAEKKERFMVQSKDQVTALLTKHATEQNTISQDKLKSLIPSSVFAKISEKLTPVDVNGEKHYNMHDLLWTFIAAAVFVQQPPILLISIWNSKSECRFCYSLMHTVSICSLAFNLKKYNELFMKWNYSQISYLQQF